jgi:hypothetical protein
VQKFLIRVIDEITEVAGYIIGTLLLYDGAWRIFTSSDGYLVGLNQLTQQLDFITLRVPNTPAAGGVELGVGVFVLLFALVQRQKNKAR